jgi:myo-inositol 2-dehydrogenase/D-chiro-inositol 1-dehydrogenase
VTRLRVGCVGTGFIAGRHLAALAGFDDVEVVAVADTDRSRARAAALPLGARDYADGPSLLESEELDAVWLCVPPFVHGGLEKAVLDAGIPMFVEKPLAADLATAEAVADRVAAAGVPAAVGYHWRYLSATRAAREFLAGRPPRMATGWWLDATPAAPWWVRRERSGGQLVEQTTHVLDVLRLLVGEVATVQAVELPAAGRPGEADGLAPLGSVVNLRFEAGSVGTVTSARFLHRRHRVGVELLGDDYALEVTERSLSDHGFRGSTGGRTWAETSTEDPIRSEDRAFLDLVLGRRDAVPNSYAEALRTHRLACAADRSAREGGTVVTVGSGRG